MREASAPCPGQDHTGASIATSEAAAAAEQAAQAAARQHEHDQAPLVPATEPPSSDVPEFEDGLAAGAQKDWTPWQVAAELWGYLAAVALDFMVTLAVRQKTSYNGDADPCNACCQLSGTEPHCSWHFDFRCTCFWKPGICRCTCFCKFDVAEFLQQQQGLLVQVFPGVASSICPSQSTAAVPPCTRHPHAGRFNGERC